MAYYLVSNEGADPVMAEVLDLKSGQLDPVLEPGGPLAIPRTVDPDHIKKLAAAYLARARRKGEP